MHEEALLQDLSRAIRRSAQVEVAERITCVKVWIGALSHVTEAALRARWGEVVDGGPAEGAELTVIRSEDPFDPRARGVVLAALTVEDGSTPEGRADRPARARYEAPRAPADREG